eukprot:CAMPEP_0116125480 /NCGR_PEP_ID=MMETSP0329-20121206/5832_1 /TAXON_ID=697910 /ORGANISM="Pseudo-nitzschia arenysensis, Strain B593" /LENGTH=384 /DNA_ID=CAMNT_0003619521 /DNA_START=279 /DNA_END=1433 /DNA_ORIENTATION=+
MKKCERERPTTPSVVANKKATVASSAPNAMDGKILKVMLEFHVAKRFNVKVDEVAKGLGIGKGTKAFSETFLYLKNVLKFIGPGENNGFKLTKEGLRAAATPEYKKMIQELVTNQPRTNKEHHKFIKKTFTKPKSDQIFDLLLEYKRLSRNQLSDLIGVNPGGHGFFYSLQELRTKEYVKMDPSNKLLFLSQKCFVNGNEERYQEVDKKKLATKLAIGRRLVESRKKGPRPGKQQKGKQTDEQIGKQAKVKKAAAGKMMMKMKHKLKNKGTTTKKKKLEKKATFDNVNKKGKESKDDEQGQRGKAMEEETRNDNPVETNPASKLDERRMETETTTINATVEGNKTSKDDEGDTREKAAEEVAKPRNDKAYLAIAGITVETLIDL